MASDAGDNTAGRLLSVAFRELVEKTGNKDVARRRFKSLLQESNLSGTTEDGDPFTPPQQRDWHDYDEIDTRDGVNTISWHVYQWPGWPPSPYHKVTAFAVRVRPMALQPSEPTSNKEWMVAEDKRREAAGNIPMEITPYSRQLAEMLRHGPRRT
jgi:hypothetical protein